jgi:hypothetical protein
MVVSFELFGIPFVLWCGCYQLVSLSYGKQLVCVAFGLVVRWSLVL